MESHSLMTNVLIYLAAATIAVPITQSLGLGSVVGYLISGVLIGPSALKFISSTEDVLHFAEFGVVMLLFLIGLELNPRRLWEMRKPIFGMGGLQVAVCTLVIGLAALAAGATPNVAILAGMGFALSSTALAVQILRERGMLQIPAGEAAFSVLLFQDLAVIPMMAILPFLGSTGDTSFSPLAFLKGSAALIGIVVAGKTLLRPAFRLIARTGLREIFTAFSLMLVLGIASLMQAVGLSMALGAFLAGVLLSDTEFRHELEVDLEPFKGLLLGLFFIAVGMSMNLAPLLVSPAWVVGAVVGLLLIKISLLYGIARFFQYAPQEATIFSLALSQGGEFAFVLFNIATQSKVLPAEANGFLSITVALSMAATPFLFMAYEKWVVPRLQKRINARKAEEFAVTNHGNPVILAGYGRIGQVVGRLLHSNKIGVTILERDPGQIEVVRRFGWPAYYGDVSRLDLLEAAGAKDAKLLIVAIDDMEAAMRTIHLVRENFPQLKLLVRADSRLDAYKFAKENVPIIRSTLSPGLDMAETAMKILGTPAFEARMINQRFQRYDSKEFNRAVQHLGDVQTLINISMQAKEELLRLMETDDKRRGEPTHDGWG
jgi:glutathione-regulated potassium-efflux system ancillary protein KefC